MICPGSHSTISSPSSYSFVILTLPFICELRMTSVESKPSCRFTICQVLSSEREKFLSPLTISAVRSAPTLISSITSFTSCFSSSIFQLFCSSLTTKLVFGTMKFRLLKIYLLPTCLSKNNPASAKDNIRLSRFFKKIN